MVSMNCRRARNLLFDFFDGLSNESLRAEVERHLGECADCERFASEMTRSLALLKHTPVEPLDETFNWKVKLAIHRERNAALSRARSAGTWVRMWNVRYAVSGGLAFGAVLIAGALVLRDGGMPSPARTLDPPAQVAQETRSESTGAATTLRPHSPSTSDRGQQRPPGVRWPGQPESGGEPGDRRHRHVRGRVQVDSLINFDGCE
jgi:anti-sigma factor RsiW